ncbi:MAG TPA: hypothetical protein VLS52_04795 [Rudaea sp.]|nr:hypothetical protein [Rudaea sp.]
MQIQIVVWGVYVLGALASRYFFGWNGRVAYLVIVGALILLFKRQLTLWLTHVASKYGMMKATIDTMPTTIALTRVPAPDAAAQPVVAELARAGFVSAGAWDIPPMPKIKLALMVHAGENFLAAIETAPSIGAQVNLHTLYGDGTVATYTNTRLPAPRALRPQVTYTRLPGLAPTALFAQARAGRRGDGIRPMSADDAPRIYEQLYADSIRYRKEKGI